MCPRSPSTDDDNVSVNDIGLITHSQQATCASQSMLKGSHDKNVRKGKKEREYVTVLGSLDR